MANKEELKRLAEIAEKDKDFCEKFTAAVNARNADEAVRLAAEKGVTLKAEEFAFSGKRELDSEELKNVAGGDLGDHCNGILAAITCIVAIGSEIWEEQH